MEYLSMPLTILALAFLFNGFPDINIGTKRCDCKNCKNCKNYE